jgi:hypothetical protein
MGVKVGFNEKLCDAPPVVMAGTAAFGLWARTVCWSARSSTSGFVPLAVVDLFDGVDLAPRLVKVELYATSEGGYQLVNDKLPNGKPYFRISVPQSRAKIPTAVRRRVYERDGWRCRECGSPDDLSLDHIYPWSKGGPDTEDNLRVLCVPCNSSKGARVE